MRDVWEKQWKTMGSNVPVETSLDEFAIKAYPTFKRWITKNEKKFWKPAQGLADTVLH